MIRQFLKLKVMVLVSLSLLSVPALAQSDLCETLLKRYSGSLAGLEVLRKRSSEDFAEKLTGEFNENEMYADDLIPRLEWEVDHITDLYLANQCNPKSIGDRYISGVLHPSD